MDGSVSKVAPLCGALTVLPGRRAQAESPSLLSEPVRLSELFRPQTFLNAVRQQTARLTGASMDSLKVCRLHILVLVPHLHPLLHARLVFLTCGHVRFS